MGKKEFEKQYKSLGNVDREILQIIALIYEPKMITELLKCIDSLGFLKELKHKDRFAAIRKLEKHFIDISENKLFIKRNIINFFIKDYCLKNPNFNFYRSQIVEMYPAEEKNPHYWGNEYYIERIIRDFRIAFFLDDKKSLEQVFKIHDKAVDKGKIRYHELYLTLFNSNFSVELMHQIPDEYKFKILINFHWKDTAIQVISYIEENVKNIRNNQTKNKMLEMLANHYFNFGNLVKLAQLISNKDIAPNFYAPSIEFLQGNIAKAKKLYISKINKILGRSQRKYCPPGIHGVYFSLTMMASDDIENNLFQSALDKGIKDKNEIYKIVSAYLASKIGEEKYYDGYFENCNFLAHQGPIGYLLLWMSNKELIDENKLMDLTNEKRYAERINCEYLIYQCHTVLTLINNKYKISSDERKKMAELAKKYAGDGRKNGH